MKTKIYVVTGATSGIGKSLITKLSKDNIIFAGYRDSSKIDLLKEISTNVYPFYVDYAKPETIHQAVEYITSKTTKIDTLVNVAGCVVAGPIEKINMVDLRRQFDINVFGHLELTQGLLDLLQDGKIINVSSMASYGVFPYIAPYCASKRCLDMLFNSLLIENKKNIQIVSIKPGVISTPLWEKSIKENTNNLVDCNGYEAEMQFMIKNAKKNEETGLSPENVVATIIKADKSKHPSLTYTVGRDAFIVRIITKLPQCVLNRLIKLGKNIKVFISIHMNKNK